MFSLQTGKGKKTPGKGKGVPMSFDVQYKGTFGGPEMYLDVNVVRIGSLKARSFDNCLASRNGFLFKIQCKFHWQSILTIFSSY